MQSRQRWLAKRARPPRGIFGQRKGLSYLAATEAWDRFSYHGMTALVVLYMVNQLLRPGHVENIAGFPGFRAALERQSFLVALAGLHAAVAAAGGVAVLVFGGTIARVLRTGA